MLLKRQQFLSEKKDPFNFCLARNNLGGANPEIIKILAEFLKKANISYLDLTQTNLGLGSPENVRFIASALSFNKNITSLILSENNLEEENTSNELVSMNKKMMDSIKEGRENLYIDYK